MVDKLLNAIANSSDRKWLLQCREHNKGLGRADVVKAIDKRSRDLDLYTALRARGPSETLEERVFESVRVYRQLLKHKHGRNQVAGYTEREIRQYGPREALMRTIRRGKKTDGLMTLAEHDRLDCAYEMIAVDFASELPEDVVEQATRTLSEFGYRS